jgi:hypothetical protein
MSAISSATALPVAAAPLPAAVASATLPLVAGADAGSAAGGGRHLHLDIKKLLLFGVAGAALGAFVPVIPGGPLGGAAIGAALALLL